MIAIVDYGTGNLCSILNMLKKVGAKGVISSDAVELRNADKLILPGVGAFDNAMGNLEKLGLIPILNELVVKGRKPILGICLGMQLLTHTSEEGKLPGLGWIDADTVRFRFDDRNRLKIPHMGWNTIEQVKKSPLLDDADAEPRFYFVHSYHVVCRKEEDVLTKTTYGYDFISSVVKNNIAGVQFHPEKSHKFGMKLLSNFAERF
jgi:glutamine amidotransferase